MVSLLHVDVYTKFPFSFVFEPPHDKTNKVPVRSAKTQISLGIRPVWSESSLCAQWVAKDPNFLHTDSEESDKTGRMPRLIWVFAGRTVIVLVLSQGGSFFDWILVYVGLIWPFSTVDIIKEERSEVRRLDHPDVWHLRRYMTKPTKWVRAQRRLRSAWASAQSDQSLRCALSG